MAEANVTPLRACVKCGGMFTGRMCKPCKKARDSDGYERNKVKRLEVNAAYRVNNQEKIRAINAAYYAGNREKLDAKSRQYRLDNLERCRKLEDIRSKKSRALDPNFKSKVTSYRVANREKFNAWRASWKRNRLKSDPIFYLETSVRNRLNEAIRRCGYTKRSKTLQALGCDWEFFKLHIERQFLSGMSWEKIGSEIHIDHITPMASAKSLDDVLALSHFTNLRPMWAKDNQSKGARITHLL